MSTSQLSAIKSDLKDLIPAQSNSNRASNQERADHIGGMLRLPFHDAFGDGTKPNGCLDPAEADHNGLASIRALVDPVCLKHASYSSLADCWSLGGSVAIESAGGFPVPFRYGRLDCDPSTTPAGVDSGLLPSAKPPGNPWHHVLDVFQERAGFSAREIVVLMGAHSLGRPSSDANSNSGFSSIPWVPGVGGGGGGGGVNPSANPGGLRLSNAFYQGIVNVKWTKSKVQAKEGGWDHTPAGASSPDSLMLDTDMSLVFDTSSCKARKDGSIEFGGGADTQPENQGDCAFNYEPYDEVKRYAVDNALFLSDFSAAMQKMNELGWSTWTVGEEIGCTTLCEVTDTSSGKACDADACSPAEGKTIQSRDKTMLWTRARALPCLIVPAFSLFSFFFVCPFCFLNLPLYIHLPGLVA